jgi:hypothetical protein
MTLYALAGGDGDVGGALQRGHGFHVFGGDRLLKEEGVEGLQHFDDPSRSGHVEFVMRFDANVEGGARLTDARIISRTSFSTAVGSWRSEPG